MKLPPWYLWLVLGAFFTIPQYIRAQEWVAPHRPRAARAAFPERDPLSSVRIWQSPDPFAVDWPQLPKPENPNRASDQQVKQEQELWRQRARIAQLKGFVLSALRDDKHRVSVTLSNHTRLEGSVISANADEFVFAPASGKPQRSFRYEDVAKWRTVSSLQEKAGTVGKDIGLILLSIPLVPLMLLAGLSGWDGC
jgi:hypothetical protein